MCGDSKSQQRRKKVWLGSGYPYFIEAFGPSLKLHAALVTSHNFNSWNFSCKRALAMKCGVEHFFVVVHGPARQLHENPKHP
jgi:hypothetical protein